jgi:hypothetical protein
VAVVGLVSSADARTQKTPSLIQDPEGYLYCRVVATSTKPIGITAYIISDARSNVTGFGYGSRVNTENGFEAEETAGSFNHDSVRYYCRVSVTGARKRDVQVSLSAFDKEGVPIGTGSSLKLRLLLALHNAVSRDQPSKGGRVIRDHRSSRLHALAFTIGASFPAYQRKAMYLLSTAAKVRAESESKAWDAIVGNVARSLLSTTRSR